MYISAGAEDNFDIDGIHNDEFLKLRADIINQDEKSKLEESCVMVEGDMPCYFLQVTAKQKSYKVCSLSLSLFL